MQARAPEEAHINQMDGGFPVFLCGGGRSDKNSLESIWSHLTPELKGILR